MSAHIGPWMCGNQELHEANHYRLLSLKACLSSTIVCRAQLLAAEAHVAPDPGGYQPS